MIVGQKGEDTKERVFGMSSGQSAAKYSHRDIRDAKGGGTVWRLKGR